MLRENKIIAGIALLIAILIFLIIYIYNFFLYWKQSKHIKEFYMPYFSKFPINFVSPAFNKIYLKRILSGFVWGTVACFIVIPILALPILLSESIPKTEKIHLVLILLGSFLILVLLLAMFPILWKKKNEKNLTSDENAIMQFKNFKNNFSILNSGVIVVPIESLSTDKLFNTRYRTTLNTWQYRIEKLNKNGNEALLMETFFEYLYSFYKIQKPNLLTNANISNSTKYTSYISLVMNNFFSI